MADNVKEKTQEVMSTVRDKSEQALEEVKNTYDKASDIVAEQSAVVADFVRIFVYFGHILQLYSGSSLRLM